MKLELKEPPSKRKFHGGDLKIPVVLGWLYRGEKGFLAEGTLHASRQFIQWKIKEFEDFLVPIETMLLENTEGLLAEDIEKIELWSNNELTWLLGL